MSPEEISKPLRAERGKVHGDWKFNASVQWLLHEQIEAALAERNERGLDALPPYQEEALKMICVKMARITAGDPSHADHWDDIAGYAMLGKGS